MKLLAYAIGGPEIAVEGAGLSGAPLRTVAGPELAAVVSQHDSAPRDRDAALLWEYENVIERIMAQTQILPLRFGSVFTDQREVEDFLRARQEELRASLRRVGGAVEFALNAGWLARHDLVEPQDSGTAYMLGKLERHRRTTQLASRLDPLRRLARGVRQRTPPSRELPIRSAYLVDNERAEEFAKLVAQLDDQLDEIELVCTGPWPPYSFAQAVEP
jgi:hypothetical protein